MKAYNKDERQQTLILIILIVSAFSLTFNTQRFVENFPLAKISVEQKTEELVEKANKLIGKWQEDLGESSSSSNSSNFNSGSNGIYEKDLASKTEKIEKLNKEL